MSVMFPVDPGICVKLVRGIADRQKAAHARPEQDEDLQQLIGRVRAASAAAAAELRSRLAAMYPAIGWINAEDEQNLPEGGASYWVYDPIDGAYHYLQTLPLWSASLALVSEGRTVFSVVYDPSLGETFVASEGAGATLNGATIRCSQKSNLNSAVVATALPPFGYGPPEVFVRSTALLTMVARRSFIVRQMASASLQLAYVAAGRLDGYWEAGSDFEDWLAGALLVREAGGTVCDLGGASFDRAGEGRAGEGIVAAPRSLSQELLGVIQAQTDGRPS
jgi:myo-inositol-1(or 4)-monophosphatase